jgi:hypothetical protein
MQRRFERGVSVDKQQFMDLLREVGPEYEPIGAKLFEAFDKTRYAPVLVQSHARPRVCSFVTTLCLHVFAALAD